MLRPARAGLVRFCGPRGGLGAWARPDRSGGGVWFGMIQHTTRTTKEVRTIPLVGGALAMLIAGSALGQLTPERLYYGVNRAIPMTVKVPEGKTGEVTVKLLEAGTAKELGSAGAAAGAVNLATLFPQVWSDAAPKVVYAQLAVGEEKVGPAVVRDGVW